MIFYLIFMLGQWFLLGKEIDHRLKIYYRVNSSLDRVVYRLLLGKVFFILYFNLLYLFPHKWIYNLFWITWVVLGLFYSWPTRGKIIQESVSSNFSEFRFLDSFEKTLVALILAMIFFSLPQVPALTHYSALRLYFDPSENFSPLLWNFITVHLYPFRSYPELFRLSLSSHFYFIGIGLFLMGFYAFLRYFVSRRLSLLGVFALLSSWSFSKILAAQFGDAYLTTYSLLFVWSVLWALQSATYRSGLFVGLMAFYGALINLSFAPVGILGVALTYGFQRRDKTTWYCRQSLKYASLGLVLTSIILLTHRGFWDGLKPFDGWNVWDQFVTIFERKGFNTLSLLGLIILVVKLLFPKLKLLKDFKLDMDKMRPFLILGATLFLYGFITDSQLISSFNLMWPVVLFALFPIELLFQSTSRLRSRRNMIYLIYIIICLLDSHFEGRVKIFLRLFDLDT